MTQTRCSRILAAMGRRARSSFAHDCVTAWAHRPAGRRQSQRARPHQSRLFLVNATGFQQLRAASSGQQCLVGPPTSIAHPLVPLRSTYFAPPAPTIQCLSLLATTTSLSLLSFLSHTSIKVYCSVGLPPKPLTFSHNTTHIPQQAQHGF
jgi:hypothetical protein